MKYIIDFVDDVTTEAIQQWLTDNQAVVVREYNSFTKTYLVETAIEPVKTNIVEYINIDVEFSTQLLTTVSETIEQETLSTSTFNTAEDWWKTATILDADYDKPTIDHIVRGAKTTVYLFDSGIKADHSEFSNANITNLYSIDGSYDDTRGHGTALASLIVGNTCGITSVAIKNVKIFSTTTVTMLSDLTHALDLTLEAILANPTRYNIINMSWAIPKNTYIESKIDELINAGAIVIVSAGNSGVPIENVTPASMPRVVTVGAYDQNFAPASFSDYSGSLSTTQGDTNIGALDGWAPGVNIRVASINGGTITANGTSLSAAIVTACISFNGDYYYYGDELMYSYNTIPMTVVKRTFGKANILDMSDPRYSTSVNKIAIFRPNATIDDIQSTSEVRTLEFAAYPNDPLYGQIMPSQFIKSMTVTGDIPAGLSVANGWLVGTIIDEVIEQYEVVLLATYEFITGEIGSTSIKLSVHKSSDAVPPIDITIDVILQAGCYCNWNGSICQQSGVNCAGECGGCRNCGDSKYPSCVCFYISCP